MKIIYGKWHISLQIGLDLYPVHVVGLGWWDCCPWLWLKPQTLKYDGLHYFGLRLGPLYYSRVW